MKKLLLLSVFLVTLQFKGFCQATLSQADRKAIIDQLRKEIWDSLKATLKTQQAAVDTSTHTGTNPWKGQLEFGGYVEVYYIYDFNNPANNQRPSFVYSHNRHNEFNINLAYAKMSYVAPRIRANVALMAGTYSNANLASEPGVLKNILEANAGFNLSSKKQVWLDGGIFASHIGFESAVGKDCWNMTRSILADNSPYYESGVKLTYTSDNGKLMVCGLILNGWQRIQRVAGSSLPSFGWQVQGKPNDKVLINSSGFIGTDKPDNVRQMRYFHNFYMIINATSKFGLIADLDAGMEQTSKGSTNYNYWFSPAFILRYAFINELAASARFEYYNDANGVIIKLPGQDPFETFGYSLNLDYMPASFAMIRLEGRLFHSRVDKIFEKRDGTNTRFDPFLGLTFAVGFGYAPPLIPTH